MAEKSTIFKIYSDLVTAVKAVIEQKYIFLKDRPNIKEDASPMKRFIVIDLPVTIRDQVIGNERTLLDSSGVFYLFVQARSNQTLDVNAAGDFVDAVCGIFPIRGECCVATNPNVQMRGTDGQDFQVITITFDIRTRMNIFAQ